MHILIVEDEPKLSDLLRDYLVQADYTVHQLFDGAEATEYVKRYQVDAIVLDIMLPVKDGISICKEVRQFSEVPILMTTAKVEEIDRLLGLELGADDYICKPYSPREVVARIKAVLRRVANQETPVQQEVFKIDRDKMKVWLNGQVLDLTTVEFQLLDVMAMDPGRIFSRQQLMDRIYNDNRVVSDRTVDSHVKKLRKKLAEANPEIELIYSVYGAGYRFEYPHPA